jgi:hypothetical protein
MAVGQSPIEGIPGVPLVWDSEFGTQLGIPPIEAVGMVAFVKPEHQAMAMADYSVAYREGGGDAYALAISGTPSGDFNGHVASGQRAVVACAPLNAGIEGWHVGVAEPGQGLGTYQQKEWLDFPAVALPVAAGGLRVWIGRLREHLNPPIIDRTLNSGLDASGARLRSDAGLLRPLTGDQVRQLCPRAVFVKPPIE